jgi:predicted O-methyltransferase YrrM
VICNTIDGARDIMSSVIKHDLLNTFLERIISIEKISRRLGVPSIEYDDGLVLSSISYITATSGGKIFIDAGAGVGYSSSWILYGLLRMLPREKILLYAIEKDPYRYNYLKENLEKLKDSFLKSLLEINVVNEDAVKFLHEKELDIDMIFVDIDKKQYIDVLKLLPEKLSKIGIGVFHNALIPGLR